MRRFIALALAAILAASTVPGVAAGMHAAGQGGSSAASVLDASAPAGGSTPAGMSTVIVTMRTRADLASIPSGTWAARLAAVISALRTHATTSQSLLVAYLGLQRALGWVARVTPFWVFNGLSITATPAVIAAIAARADVASVTPDEIPIVPAGAQAPARPASPAITSSAPNEPNIALVNAPAMWTLGYTGQGVVVANLDSGVDVTHPDLAARWRGGTDSWFDPYGQHPTTPTDLTGHGTATMGVIVGGDAGGTSIGMAPGATWIAAKIFNDSGTATSTAIHAALQWVLDPDGNPATADAPQVVNNSWAYGFPGCNLAFQPDLQALRAAGIVPVFAAGNYGPGGSTSVSPANYPEALAVGGTKNTDLIDSTSGRGPSACGEASTTYPEIVAPGVNIRTADRFGLYQTATGTSLAAPHVAGALALLLSASPGATVSSQVAALTGSSKDLGTVGPDNTYGYGRLDVLAANTILGGGPTPSPSPSPDTSPSPSPDPSASPSPDPSPSPSATPTPTPTPPPVTTGAGLAPNLSNGSSAVTLSATVTSTGSTVNAAEYFVDAIGADGTGCPFVGTFGTASSSVTASIPTFGATAPCADLSALASGNHTFAVHGQGAAGAWGATASAVLVLDKSGPSVSGVSVTPGLTSGAVDVVLGATGSDAASGGQNVTAAEYSIDAGSPTPISIPAPAADVPLTATIGAPIVASLSDGSHTVYVRAKDALGNWGVSSSATLTVDRTGPATGAVTLAPSAANSQAVAIGATADDTATGNSSITGGEFFVDTAGADGSGTALTVGAASPSTTLSGTIPGTTVAALAAGTHAILVHARDAAGTWGARVSATLLVDRTAPKFSGITLNPSSISTGAVSVGLAVNGASDGTGGSGVAGGEWWIGTTNITAGTGTAFSGMTASVATGALTPGAYTVRVRVRDAAGNWSVSPSSGVRTATLTVTAPIPDAIFADGFETGTTGAWSSTSGTTSVTAPAALVGAFGLAVAGNATNRVQYNFGTAANPATATYDARFYFRPNANTSSGKDILSAATSSTFGTTLFRVRYRLSGTTPQVQVVLGATGTSATWTTVLGGTSSNVIEVAWQSTTTLQLYVNGTLSQTLTAGAGSVGAVRLGSLTSTGNAAGMYFDAFASKRSASPLIGP